MQDKISIEHESIILKLTSKLKDISTSSATIEKVFSFTMEDLQDTPNVCVSEVYQYLTEHQDKIKDYRFTTQIHSDTFKPLLTMHIVPVDHIAASLQASRNSIWENLANADTTVIKLSEELANILKEYIFEFNDKNVRSKITSQLSEWLKSKTTDEFVILDETSVFDTENGVLTLMIGREGKTFKINEYLKFLNDRQLLLIK